MVRADMCCSAACTIKKFKHNNMKHLILILLLITGITLAEAQSVLTKGLVVDADGTPIVGASVQTKGYKAGTTTDSQGEFSMSVPAGTKTLVVSFVGMKRTEVALKNYQKIVLYDDACQVDEVVVVAYGAQKKRNLTSAVSSVKSEQMANIPATSLEQSLQGKAAGVSITQATGAPGGAFSVNIRGVSSYSAGTQPLYVVDGVQIISTDVTNASGYQSNAVSGIADINPADIERIEVLKDASASALYGSRASNGVILITTKHGRCGRTKVSLDSYVGWQDIPHTLDYLGTSDYISARNEAIDNYNKEFGAQVAHVSAHDPNADTNWFDAVTRNALQTSHQLSISGGTDRTQFFLSGGAYLQNGVEKQTDYTRYNLRLNVSHQISRKLHVDANIALSAAEVNRATGDGNIYGPWYNAKVISPDYSVYTADGDYTTLPNSWRNPLKLLDKEKNNSKKYRAIVGVKGTWNILPGLDYHINIGGDYIFTHEVNDWPSDSYQGESVNGEIEDNRCYNFNNLVENTLNYNHSFGDLNFGALIGYSYQKRSTDNARLDVYNFLSTALKYASSAGSSYSPSGTYAVSALQSVFGRVNLAYSDRYLMELSLRSDASSKFAKGNRTGYFPAVSAGWRISSEKFYPKNAAVNDLKLRASVGSTGNQEGIGEYSYQQTYSASGIKYQDSPGLSFQSAKANNNLKWEKTVQYGVGVDFALLDSRLEGTLEWYKKDTKDLLLSHSINGLSGYSTTTSNVGSITNDGLELSLTSHNLKNRNFSWDTSLTLTYSRNKVTGLSKDANGNDVDITTGYCNILRKDESFAAFYLIKQLGIYQTDDEVPAALYAKGLRAGDVKYYDANGDGDITSDDRVIAGTPFPKVYGSLINTLTYRGFDLTLDLQYSLGNKLYASWKAGTNGAGNLGGNKNGYAIVKSDWEDRWTGAGTSNTVPRAIYDGSGSSAYTYNTLASTRYLENADFLRIRNITLGYTFSKKLLTKMSLQNLRVYATVNNLHCFTKYDGFDPEIAINPYYAYYRGTDLGSVPQSRSFIFGLNVSF